MTEQQRGGSGGRSPERPESKAGGALGRPSEREGRESPRSNKMFPEPPEDAQPFFDAARDHRLLIQRCGACGSHQFYPRKICTTCGAADPEWVEASGRGKVHTYTVVHRGMPGWRESGPYVAAIIELEEGVRMTTNVIDCRPEDVSIDMLVEVTFVDEGTYVLPRFRPNR